MHVQYYTTDNGFLDSQRELRYTFVIRILAFELFVLGQRDIAGHACLPLYQRLSYATRPRVISDALARFALDH